MLPAAGAGSAVLGSAAGAGVATAAAGAVIGVAGMAAGAVEVTAAAGALIAGAVLAASSSSLKTAFTLSLALSYRLSEGVLPAAGAGSAVLGSAAGAGVATAVAGAAREEPVRLLEPWKLPRLPGP